jgi:ubiquinone/menaquinone biosynthesis C-methylase UbiE
MCGQAGDRVLIVGGGTGWVLESLPRRVSVTYVESSAKMIALARKRTSKPEEVQFVCQPVEDFQTEDRYDVLLTGFLFDNFSAGRSKQVLAHLDTLLVPGGRWLYTDFRDKRTAGKWWQRLLMGSMYLFFRWISRVEGRYMVETGPLFAAAGYRRAYEATFYGGLIETVTYCKN